MIKLWLCAVMLLAWPAAAQAPDEIQPIQRHLEKLYLGDSLSSVQRIYRPTQEWPSYIEPRGRVKRVRVERAYAKNLPAGIATIWLGFKLDRLVEVQIIYDQDYTRQHPADEIAGGYALIYGEARRSEEKFWWSDSRTVLRVYNAELPGRKVAGKSVEMRTSVQIFERDLFRRTD
ncbi:MAG: hypothetical protein WC881_00855 [Elusimicrobiota bacterium]|jgi:hypothetical protein